jgi:hypothetical protein
MNYRTTFFLLIFVALAGAGYYFGPQFVPNLPWASPAATTGAGTGAAILANDVTAEKLTKITLHSSTSDVALERGQGGEWSLQGKWPVRKAETDELVKSLTDLRSRFTSINADPAILERMGLDKPAVTVKVQSGDATHELQFGEEQGEQNRFSRPTYLRVDNKDDIIRLGPGLIAQLDKPQDYYQQRRLFPSERVAKDPEAVDRIDRVDRLNAKELDVHGPAASYALEKQGADWQLREPVKDRVDPDKLNSLLTAVPDVWAESFVAKPKADLAEYGLKDPKESIRVVRPSGDVVTLQLGKQSQVKVRKVMRPAPSMGGPPMPPQEETIHDEYRYAKLAGNDQVFEILADKLKDLFVAGPSLRDPKLARFKTDDVRRMEIRRPDSDLVLVKDKDKWKIEKPINSEAEAPKISEILDKLANWQATGKEVFDKADAKTYGLDKAAATITLTVDDEVKEGDKKIKKSRDIVFNIGKVEAEKGKLFVRVGGWDRVNQLEDSAWKLVDRPALAYRGRRIIDTPSTDLARIDLSGPKEKLDLEQTKGEWKLAAPVSAEADRSKAGILANDLTRLEAVEFVTEKATPDELDKTYGLAKPALTVKLSFSDAKKAPITLLIGKPQKEKGDYFAKLESSPAVFTIRKDIFDTLSQDSLAYRPLRLAPQRLTEDIHDIKIEKGAPEYTLHKEGENWKLTGPFSADVKADAVRPLAEELGNLSAEKYVAHSAKDLTKYGLDKPYLRVTLPAAAPEKSATPPVPTPTKATTILIGMPTEANPKARYAKTADSDAVVVLPEKAVAALDHVALDFVDRDVLKLDAQKLEKIKAKGFALQKQGDSWRVIDSPAPAFAADRASLAPVLASLSHLQAARIASYGGKPDLAAYGLDKPAAEIGISLQPAGGKPEEHTLVIGKTVDAKSTERFARVDQGAVFVLAEPVWKPLLQDYLAYVDPDLSKIEPGKVSSIARSMNGQTVELLRKDARWEVKAKGTQPGDAPTLNALADQLAQLHAKRIAAYPVKDPSAFGLDKPAATLTIRYTGADGKPASEAIQVGKPVDAYAPKGDHFARAEKSTTVGVLPGELVATLLAPDLEFRDRNLVNVSSIDRATVERGQRKAVFAEANGVWKMVQPVEAPAEQTELQEFISAASHLRADRLIADKAADLKSYGLDKPAARWIFQSGGKDALELLLGKSDAGKLYAKLANSDLVFTLDPNLSKQAEAEFRSRTVWPAPVDAVQIEHIHFGGQSPFTLEKVDNVWKIAGKSDAKVNEEAVKELLDGLAGLKSTRFVADKTTDFKLYGLDPSERTIELQTPAGKRTLLIGRQEGESKRYYARVPEGDAAQAVFILGENEARKILKTPAELTQANPAQAAPAK